MVLEILKSPKIWLLFYGTSLIFSTSVPLIRPLRDCGSPIEARWNIQLGL